MFKAVLTIHLGMLGSMTGSSDPSFLLMQAPGRGELTASSASVHFCGLLPAGPRVHYYPSYWDILTLTATRKGCAERRPGGLCVCKKAFPEYDHFHLFVAFLRLFSQQALTFGLHRKLQSEVKSFLARK